MRNGKHTQVEAAAQELARRVLRTEGSAVLGLVDQVDDHLPAAVQMLHDCRGRVILTGMGKSGIISRKIAATLTSTGTAAFFLHPAEAVHGDLGVIQKTDVIMALSYSGETEEILRLLSVIRRIGAALVAITGSPASTLAMEADVALSCQVDAEACPMNLAPTASTTAALALGDALAMVLLVQKGFCQENFAELHPGGRLGKRLMRLRNLMHTGSKTPVVTTTAGLRDVICEMSSKGLGMTCVVDASGQLQGIVTDGDLRRVLHNLPDGLEHSARDAMTPNPSTIGGDVMAVEALRVMEQRKITSLVVVDDARRIEGVIHLHDLWRTEMF